MQPEVIILDEPTGGLDPLMQQKFFDLIRAENQKGATVLFSSHILSEVQKLCGRVAIIKDGSIVRVENIRDMQKHNYKKFTLDYRGLIDVQHFNLEEVTNLTVDENTLRAAKLVQGPCDAVKLLGNGTLTKSLNVIVDFVSASAREKVTQAGGTVTVLSEA
mgnify:CR=1 FL=1